MLIWGPIEGPKYRELPMCLTRNHEFRITEHMVCATRTDTGKSIIKNRSRSQAVFILIIVQAKIAQIKEVITTATVVRTLAAFNQACADYKNSSSYFLIATIATTARIMSVRMNSFVRSTNKKCEKLQQQSKTFIVVKGSSSTDL